MMRPSKLTDYRVYQRAIEQFSRDLEARFNAFETKETAAMAAATASLQALIAQLAAKPYAVLIGERSITVGSLVSITTAGVRKATIGAAGVKPTDHAIILQPTVAPPDGYGFPQAICRSAGFIEVRITVPQLAIGVQQVIPFNVIALRTEIA